MRKRLLAIVMSAAMVLSLVPSLAFAGTTTQCQHQNKTEKYALVDADVALDAVTKANIEVVAANAADPTCIKKVVRVTICDAENCGEVIGNATLVKDAKGHTWGTTPQHVDKNCQTYDVYTCTVCGATEKRNVNNDTGKNHNFSRGIVQGKEATCTEPATYGDICSACGYTTNEKPEGKALGHDIKDRVASTAADGTVTYTYDGAATKIDATCQYEGKVEFKCGRTGCDYSVTYGPKDDPALEQKAHKYDETALVTVSPATCTELAVSAYVCKTCKDTGNNPYTGVALTKAYDKDSAVTSGKVLGHDFTLDDPAKTDVRATCTTAGVDYQKCSRCDATNETVIPATDHSWTDSRVEKSEATCLNPQVLAQQCTVCHVFKEGDDRIGEAALGHDYGELETIKEATCTEAEVKGKVCSRCDAVTDVQEGAPATNHSQPVEDVNSEDWVIIWPNCTDNPCAVQYCKNALYDEDDELIWACDEVIARRDLTDEEIAKLGDKYKPVGHNYRLKDVKDATCSENGVRTYVCWECEAVKEETVTKLPHTAEAIPAVAATYTKTGLTAGEKCSVCDTVTVAQKTVAKKVLAQAKTPTVKAGKGYIKVSYKAVKDATGYQIVVKRTGEKKVVTVKSAKAATKTIKKLKSGKTYKVYVRAYRTEGKTTVYGKYAPVKSIKVK